MLYQNIQSFRNLVFFNIRKKLKITRKKYSEKPVRLLKNLNAFQIKRTIELQKKYKVQFENFFNEQSCLLNYQILDLLDQTQQHWNWKNFQNQTLIDVGSRNFYYAPAFNAFFKPQKCTGIEIDAYRLYQSMHTRFSYAQFFIKDFKNFDYQVMDFLKCDIKADGFLMFYPFLNLDPVLEMELPINLLKPSEILNHVVTHLNPNGWIFIVNESQEEFDSLFEHATLLKLNLVYQLKLQKNFLENKSDSIISLWQL